jgi:alcohol dehydrogenase class IV
MPTRVVFEVGVLGKIGKLVSPFGKRSLLIVGQGSLKKLGVVGEILQSLKQESIQTSVFEGVRPNPTANVVYDGARMARDSSADFVIGLGGGSVMDAAKAISLAATHNGDFWEYRLTGRKGITAIEDRVLPVVTVPTLSGTGSEVSPACLITKNRLKEVIVSPHMCPRLAIVDPRLTTSVPSTYTAEAGLDTFVQSMEAYVSSEAQPLSDMFALESMTMVIENLRNVLVNGENLEARCRLSLAAILSSYAIGQAGVGAIHALSNPISGHYDARHGQALAIVLPEVVAFNLDSKYERYAKVAGLLGIKTERLPPRQAAGDLVSALRDLLKNLGLLRHLREFGASQDDLEILAKEAQNPDIRTNPKPMSVNEILQIFRAVF